jgi:peptidoglycan/LPS O-acetylase OafA/YrhL
MSLEEKIAAQKGVTTGFDYLRIGLALFVLVFHSVAAAGTRGAHLERLLPEIWAGPWRFIPTMVLPMFFALSGYLVAASLLRNSIHHFIALRALRLLPALAFETLISAIIIGLLFTTLPWTAYLERPEFWLYFGNIVGWIHYFLPGVFEHNPVTGYLNGQLWTIPFELECYVSVVILSSFILRSRFVLVLGITAACAAFTLRVYHGHAIDAYDKPLGRVLVLSFLAGVAVYLYRDTLEYSRRLGFASGLLAAICFEVPNLCYLAALPIAYFTVWLGIAKLPKIKFGDLSYGIYLFHYPVQQTIVATFLGLGWAISWPLLALLSLPATGFCAWFSWNFVESPVLSRKRAVLGAMDRWLSVSLPKSAKAEMPS